jgi:hypothetical protein
MARGNRREAIDLDDADRDLFRETFAEAKSQKLDCDEDLRDLEPVRKLVGGPPGRWERSDWIGYQESGVPLESKPVRISPRSSREVV